MGMDIDPIQSGFEQLQNGDRKAAAQIFVEILRQEPQREEAWLLLAECVKSPRQKRDCLERVLRINAWNETARQALEALEQVVPDLNGLLEQAREAEAELDYDAAYDAYTKALNIDPSCTPAWFGKGFTAGMRSSPGQNRVREFFECLQYGMQVSAAMKSIGVPRSASERINTAATKEMIAQIEPAQVPQLTQRIMHLGDYVIVLAERCEPNMANIYTVERVHLADWAYHLARLPGVPACESYTREALMFIATDAYARIALRARQTTRGTRSRHELMQNFKLFLLSNLSLSGINKDIDLLEKLERIEQS